MVAVLQNYRRALPHGFAGELGHSRHRIGQDRRIHGVDRYSFLLLAGNKTSVPDVLSLWSPPLGRSPKGRHQRRSVIMHMRPKAERLLDLSSGSSSAYHFVLEVYWYWGGWAAKAALVKRRTGGFKRRTDGFKSRHNLSWAKSFIGLS